MANFLYNSYKTHALSGTMDLSDGNVHTMLVTNSYDASTTSKAAHAVTGDITAEVAAGDGYDLGGKAIGTPLVTQDDVNHVGEFGGDPVAWTTSTITASGAIIYHSGGTPATSRLIGYVDFGSDHSSSLGTFQVTWNSNGIINLGDS